MENAKGAFSWSEASANGLREDAEMANGRSAGRSPRTFCAFSCAFLEVLQRRRGER